MATRVDPEAYRDSPIFRDMLRERRGRWPGIPMDELPPLSVAVTTLEALAQTRPPAMFRVEPLSSAPDTPLTDYDPENMPERDWDADPDATVSMPLPDPGQD